MGASAGAALVGACGSGGSSTAPADLAYVPSDYSGARLSAILRASFIDEANELMTAQVADWSRAANVTLDARILNDWREAYMTVAERREGDDLAELFGSSTHLWSDRLVDVSDLAETLGDLYGGWMPAAADGAVVDGVWRAIPWLYTAQAINFREDFLAAAGARAPETYDDLLETATRLRDAGQPLAGFSMNDQAPNDSASFAYSMLWSFGGQEVGADGRRVALDSEATRAALRFFRDLAAVSDRGTSEFDEAANNDAFLNSQISMTQNASSIYWKALQQQPVVAEAMNHVKYPSGPGGFHQLVELNSIAIFNHSRNVDAAKDWIRWMMEPAQLRPRAETALSFFTPSLEDYVDDPDMPWNTDPKLAGMRGIHDGGHLAGWPGPASLEADLVHKNATLVKMFGAVGYDNASIDWATRTAAEELRRVYET